MVISATALRSTRSDWTWLRSPVSMTRSIDCTVTRASAFASFILYVLPVTSASLPSQKTWARNTSVSTGGWFS